MLPGLATKAVRLQWKSQGLWFEPGDAVRYQGLGAGRVVRHVTRNFQGRNTTFAVIDFPHRDMTAQIPLGDPGFASKLRPVASASSVKRLLMVLREQGNKLPRTWDGRESYGVVCLREGSPAEWAELLRDYAEARKGGMSITASDADLVRAAIQLLAAEYCCAAEVEFEQAWSLVHGAYEKASL
jgi:RNA polymerase-interacting CarD/CdnL/TRCF family regulator